MNQAEKEQYLREYSLLKNEGKPFFPYAVAKDSLMAVIVMIVIMLLALLFGAELGPKVNPTSTTYVPRPDWYFFFLFEVLRVMKNVPKFTPMATIGVPTICMIALFLLPIYDRSPERLITRRPVALAAGLATIACIAFLTFSGANTGSPNQVELPPPSGLTAAAAARRSWRARSWSASPAARPATRSDRTATTGPGRRSPTSARSARPAAIASTLKNPTAPMPSFANMAKTSPKKFAALVPFLSDLQ